MVCLLINVFWVLFLSRLFSQSIAESVPPYYKIPIFWKQLNDTEFEMVHGRKLHDYLSMNPTYGDSKKTGYAILFCVIISYFYSLMYVGNPPQRQTVILDTGSSILAFPCSSYH